MHSDNVKNNRPDEFDLILALVIVGGFMVLLLLFWATLGPTWQDHQLQQGLISQSQYESQIRLHNRIAQGLSAILPSLSGLALSGTALAAIGNFRVAEANRKISEETRKVAEEKQITDLFVKAVEMLGDARLEVRIGGIYALERIARNFDKDHWTVMEVLTAFIQKTSDGEAVSQAADMYKTRKNKTFTPDPVSSDIQAAVRVIGKRDVTKDPDDGKVLSFVGGNFSGIFFLEEADFRRTYLIGASCYMSFLAKARFDNVDLSYADLRSSSLLGASFVGARLEDADLRGAILKDAVFSGTDLKGADLRNVKGREAAQIVAAKNWWLAEYDDEFAKELTEFAQKQAEHDPEFVEQLKLFEQNRQAQSDEPENPSDTSG